MEMYPTGKSLGGVIGGIKKEHEYLFSISAISPSMSKHMKDKGQSLLHKVENYATYYVYFLFLTTFKIC